MNRKFADRVRMAAVIIVWTGGALTAVYGVLWAFGTAAEMKRDERLQKEADRKRKAEFEASLTDLREHARNVSERRAVLPSTGTAPPLPRDPDGKGYRPAPTQPEGPSDALTDMLNTPGPDIFDTRSAGDRRALEEAVRRANEEQSAETPSAPPAAEK